MELAEKIINDCEVNEKSSKNLEKSLKIILDLDSTGLKEVIEFIYRSIYTHSLLWDSNCSIKIKEKVVAITKIIQYFLDFKSRWPATISSAEEVVKYIRNFCAPDRETFIAVYLDTHNNVISTSIISYGTIDFAYVNVKMIFSYALKFESSKLILVHNHPSGDPSPSSEDIAFTNKISTMAKDFGIVLLDHIIVANSFFSFKCEGML
ncbi:MAG: JAB domain-containing protein [Spirochaetales bacterium]|nr:JAB domain-containing protein [Spirochaetales bacterium]